MTKCALSQKEAKLQMSHIYPKFAVRYLRETSNNGRLRNYKNVNIARQDGLKMPLLSRDSEQRFSVAETWFANNVFYPVVKTELKKFSYDDHLYYFIVSLLWRALQVELKSGTYDNEEYFSKLLACEKEWRSFLYEGYVPFYYAAVNMIITHPNHVTMPNIPSSQYYLLRNLDLTIVSNDNDCLYVYAKLPRFLFWAPIYSPHISPASLIDMRGGYFDSLEPPYEPSIMGFLPNRVIQINDLQKELSPQQEASTLANINKDKEGFEKSEAGRLFKSQE